MRRFPGPAGLLAGFVLLLPGCEQLPNIPPQAAFVYSPVSPILAGQTSVIFNASGSRDADGTITSYVWNFGDGSPDQTATGPTVGHVFPDTAARCLEITYTVLLTVVDDGGERATASAAVKVTELPFPTDVACLPPTR